MDNIGSSATTFRPKCSKSPKLGKFLVLDSYYEWYMLCLTEAAEGLGACA